MVMRPAPRTVPRSFSPLRRPWRARRGRLLAAPLVLLACLGQGGSPGALAAPPPELDCAAAAAALRLQRAGLRQRAADLEVVLLGEIHSSAADHVWQLRTLDLLARGGRPLALGLEMVPAARQPILTRFATGQLEEGAFLRAVDWPAMWGHDPALYLPLLRWARRQGVPLLALNVEPEVVRRVRRQGLAATPAEDREGIGLPVPAGSAYRRRLRAAWQVHRALDPGALSPATGGAGGRDAPLSPAEAEDLERFIASQLLRDRAMAERLAAARRRDPARLVVALIGRGHLEDDDGVPAQLRQLGPRRIAALTRPEAPEGCGPPPAGARLGAYLESGDGAVWVRRVASGSAAAAAGLRPGDRLRAVNGEPVQRAGQVIRRVREQPVGVPLRLTIERAGRRREVELRLAPPAPAGSPGTMETRLPLDRAAAL